MHGRRIGLTAAAVGAAAALLVGCGSSSSTSASSHGSSSSCTGSAKRLMIANVDDFSGAANVYAAGVYDGAQLAVNQINAAGGIKALCGAKLSLQKFDTQSNPDEGPPEITKALADHPVAIIGGTQGATVLAAANISHRQGIPWLITTVSSDQITARHYPELLMPYNDSQTAASLISLLKKYSSNLGLSSNASVEYVYSQGTFGVSSYAAWNGLKANPFRKAGAVTYPATTTDFSAVAARVADANAKIIIAACYPTDCISLARLWKTTVHPKAKMIILLGGTASTLVPPLKSLANNLVVIGSVEPGQPGLPKAFETFSSEYQKDFKSPPGFTSPTAYINVKFIAKALQEAGSTNPAKLTAALHKVTLTQTDGNLYALPKVLSWSAQGTLNDATQLKLWAQIQNGKQELIYPTSQAPVKPYGAG